MFLDSVSYESTVLSTVPPGQRFITIDNATNYEVLTGFFILFDPPIPTGVGKWATFWMTADAGAADQVIAFDSAKIEPSGDFVVIALAGNEGIAPQFAGGTITIGNPQSNTPPTLTTIGPRNIAEGANLMCRKFKVNNTSIEFTLSLRMCSQRDVIF